ncbi:MAG: hypothetical protein AB7Q37_18740 [Pyrinomonadaceae bacterium]
MAGENDPNSAFAREFFIYQQDFAGLAAGATMVGNIQIQADSDFLLRKLTYFADIAGAAQTDSGRVIPLVSLQITDTGSGRFLMERSVPITDLFGTGELPFIIPTPKLFTARAVVSLQVSNFSAATDYNLRLSFIGEKLYRRGY